VPVLADDEVIVRRDAERARGIDAPLGHLDVGARRRRVAGGVIRNFFSVSSLLKFLSTFESAQGSRRYAARTARLTACGKAIERKKAFG
jgi:hypothetical protein